MKLKSLATVLFFLLLLVVPSFANILPKCSAQTNSLQIPFQISYSMYNWTSDMNRLSMTTPETGIIFNVTVFNSDNLPLMIGYSSYNSYYSSSNSNNEGSLTNIIELSSSDNTELGQLSKTISFDSSNELYLPPNTGESFFVEFDQNGNSFSIGSYTTKLSYNLNSVVSYGYNGEPTSNTPIGQYPFNFQVETQKTLDNAIAQNPSPQTSQSSSLSITSIILIVVVSIIVAVVLSVALTFLIITRTRFKEKFAEETKKKYQLFGGLATILSLFLSFLAVYIAYLQLIKV